MKFVSSRKYRFRRSDAKIAENFLERKHINLAFPPLAAGATPRGFPKERRGTLTFGRQRGSHPAGDIDLITLRSLRL
jgi:hypothetical protein